MLRKTLFFLSLSGLLATAGLRAQSLTPRQRVAAAPPARKEKFQVYLLVGQSSMAGRGTVEAQDTSVTIGLIPGAVGGSGIDAWVPGAYFESTKAHPYDDALARARTALAAGTLAGIVWNQGETDTSPEKSAAYAPKLAARIARLRAALSAPNVPFVAGQLPAFPQGTNDPAGVARVNAALARLGKTVPHYACVPATGTTDRGDHLHLAAASARRMGQRYAAAMRQVQRAARHGKQLPLRSTVVEPRPRA